MKDIDNLLDTIRQKAKEHKETVCIGRSHGVHAEPMTFGVKLCGWLDLFERNKRNFEKAMNEAAEMILAYAHENDVVLLKASHGIALERIVPIIVKEEK